MIVRPDDAIHKSYLNRILIEICDNPDLPSELVFKGGTAAAMLGYLDRFSVDLDFDLVEGLPADKIKLNLNDIFASLDLDVVKEFDRAIMYEVKYQGEGGGRSRLKVSVNTVICHSSQVGKQYLKEIDRYLFCQTIETMFAHKLVAILDRYEKYRTIAGRDIYDIHHFYLNGYGYHEPVITERTGVEPKVFLAKLAEFVAKEVTQTVIDQDLNMLLPPDKFHQIRKVLLPETLNWLNQEARK